MQAATLAFEWHPMDDARQCDIPGCAAPARFVLTIVAANGAEPKRLHGGDCCPEHAQERAEGLGVTAPC